MTDQEFLDASRLEAERWGLPPEVDRVSHPIETDQDVAEATGEDVHDEDRHVFPEDARFTDEEWSAVEAARATLEDE